MHWFLVHIYIYIIYIILYAYIIYIINIILNVKYIYSVTLDILGYKKLRNEANSEIVIFTHQVVGIPMSP